MDINNNRILITGSTGFVGAHLAKRLVEFRGARIRALVKDQSISTQLIDELPVEKVFGDMVSLDAMRRVISGCDAVVHCAVGEPYENALGTWNVIQAAKEQKVKKFIHLSSTAVFGYCPQRHNAIDGRLKASSTKKNYHTAYSRSKIESERIAFLYHDKKKLPLVVLRLAHVFGPYSACWTTRPIKMLQQNCITIINDGLSPSNSVYIDNATEAIVQSLVEDNAVGHALTICDDEPTTWIDFFQSYSRMLSENPPLIGITQVKLKDEHARLKSKRLKESFLNPVQLPSFIQSLAEDDSFLAAFIEKPFVRKLVHSIHPRKCLGGNLPSDCVQFVPSFFPEIWLEKTFTLPFHFPTAGAKEILGFKSRVSFEEGMSRTRKWLRLQEKGLDTLRSCSYPEFELALPLFNTQFS